MPRHPRNGLGSGSVSGSPGNLVASGIESPKDHFVRRHALRDPRVEGGLFFLVGTFLPFEQKELGSEEPDTLRAGALDEIEFVLEFNVGRERDAAAVGGDRIVVAEGVELRALHLALLFELAVACDRLRRGIGDEPAGIPVQDAGIEGVEIEDGVLESHDGGNAERTGEDRGVGVGAALLGGEPEHIVPVHGRGGRGSQVVGDEDVLVIGLLDHILLAFGCEVAQDALADILDIGSPVAQEGIRNAAHGLELVLHHRVEAVLGILPPLLDRLGNAIQDNRVLEDEEVGLEDAALFVSGERLHVRAEAVELLVGAAQGGVEALDLAGHRPGGDGMDFRRGKSAGHHVKGPEHDPTGDGCPLVDHFLLHPGHLALRMPGPGGRVNASGKGDVFTP